MMILKMFVCYTLSLCSGVSAAEPGRTVLRVYGSLRQLGPQTFYVTNPEKMRVVFHGGLPTSVAGIDPRGFYYIEGEIESAYVDVVGIEHADTSRIAIEPAVDVFDILDGTDSLTPAQIESRRIANEWPQPSSRFVHGPGRLTFDTELNHWVINARSKEKWIVHGAMSESLPAGAEVNVTAKVGLAIIHLHRLQKIEANESFKPWDSDDELRLKLVAKCASTLSGSASE